MYRFTLCKTIGVDIRYLPTPLWVKILRPEGLKMFWALLWARKIFSSLPRLNK